MYQLIHTAPRKRPSYNDLRQRERFATLALENGVVRSNHRVPTSPDEQLSRMHQSNDGPNGGVAPNALRSPAKQRELSEILEGIVGSRSSRDQIRAAVSPVCAQARDENIDATELVKLVKQAFAESQLVNALGHAGERQQALDRIISVCIDEYYGGG